jgi:2,3-bisphosphoglycerate-dependent phosphoglycerate mutase
MKHLYFVRHAEPDHDWEDDRTRPLSSAGLSDSGAVTLALRDITIDLIISSPYIRTVDTIRETASEHGLEIVTDERLREREQGSLPNSWEMIARRWNNFKYREGGGESLDMVRKRNMAAIFEYLTDDTSDSIVIGTHGTSLSTILNYFDPAYGFDGFKRMINYMPYIIRLDFDGLRYVGREEILIVEKAFIDRYLNNVAVRQLELCEIPEGLRLVWDTFLEFEAPDYVPEGVNKFKEYLDDRDFIGTLTFYGAYIHGLLAGVLATRDNGKHIAVFFVRGEYHRHGIGKKLFTHVKNLFPGEIITVNSSPYAVPIYGRLGFVPTDTEQVSDGIRYTPMKYLMNTASGSY